MLFTSHLAPRNPSHASASLTAAKHAKVQVCPHGCGARPLVTSHHCSRICQTCHHDALLNQLPSSQYPPTPTTRRHSRDNCCRSIVLRSLSSPDHPRRSSRPKLRSLRCRPIRSPRRYRPHRHRDSHIAHLTDNLRPGVSAQQQRCQITSYDLTGLAL